MEKKERGGGGGREEEKKRKPIFIDIVIWDVYFQEILLLPCISSSTSEHSTGSKFAQLSLKDAQSFLIFKIKY